MSIIMTDLEQYQLLDKLGVFKIQGRDKRGHKIIRIIAKLFPGRNVSAGVVKMYLEEKIFPKLEKRLFSVLYVHTDVERSENFPGIIALKSIYDVIPVQVKENLQAVYFLHPGIQSRLFLATFGRFIFGGGLYGKLRYINRVEFLLDHMKRNEIEIPDFVHDHDEDLEHHLPMDYGLESDLPRVYNTPVVDSAVAMYSMRCIS